jgi:hypothetical protein
MAEHIKIGDISPRIQYTADGTQTVFTYPFPVFSSGDIQAFVDATQQTITTHYSVAGAGLDTGGTVTFIAAPSDGAIITLVRDLTVERSSDFQESGEFRAKVINDELDKIIAMVQETDDALIRTLHQTSTDLTGSLTLPEKSTRASKALGFDVNGDPAVSTIDLGAIESGAMDASASAAEALTSEYATAADAVSTASNASAAAASALSAATAAAANLYSTIINKTDIDSPISPVLGNDGALFVCDTSGGNMAINMPSIAIVGEGFRVCVQKSSGTNTITLNRDGTDTINGSTNFVMYVDTEFVTLVADETTPDNWVSTSLTTTQAGSGLAKSGATLSLEGGVTIDTDGNLSGYGSEINAQSGTTYTLLGSDNGKIVTLNNASAITVTIPETASESIAAGFQCTFIQRGAGQVTFAKEGSDTIESKDSLLSLTGQHSIATIAKITAGSPNTYGLYGDLV